MVAEICTFPLDTAKTILQLQGSADHSTQYRGTADCLYTVARHEGVGRLYRGLSPAVVRQAVYGTIKYGLYYSVKVVVMWRWGGGQESMPINIVCGILAGQDHIFNYHALHLLPILSQAFTLFFLIYLGGISSAIANPTDVMKVRMQGRTTREDTNMLSICLAIMRREGLGGLWRGRYPQYEDIPFGS